MNIADMPFMILIGALLAIIALFVIAAGFRLPESYKEKEAQRALMRKRYMELELAEKDADKELKAGAKEPPAKA
jgi:uncharacterized membrane protein